MSSEPELRSNRYDPTGKYAIEWVDGEITCQCAAYVKGGMRPCNHIKWLKLRDRLPQMPRAQRDQLAGVEPAQPRTLGEAIVGTEEEQAKREPMVCFPMVDDELSVFPMTLSTFLSGLSHVDIDYRKGGLLELGVPSIKRRLGDIGNGVVRIHWAGVDEKGNQVKGHTDLDSDKLIEHREWRMGKTQYTIMGAGGCLWIEGDNVVCTKTDGDQVDVETWLAELASKHHQ
jgi:hypothetical protein